MNTNIQILPPSIEKEMNWDKFFKVYWGNKPVLFKKPFERPIINKNTVMDFLKARGDLIRGGNKSEIVLYDKNKEIVTSRYIEKGILCGLEGLLPKDKDNALDLYIRSISQREKYETYCLYLSYPHTYPEIWNSIRKIIKNILKFIPITPAGLNTDMFIGNYKNTHSGVHKDNIDNFMFMLHGTRRMLLWDEYTWKEQLGNPDNIDYSTYDYEAFRPFALTAELEEGDMLYWPSSYWHVGENSGDYSVSFNIDYNQPKETELFEIVNKNILNALIKSVVYKQKKDGKNLISFHNYPQDICISPPNEQNNLLKDVLYSLKSSSDSVEYLHKREWLKYISSFGFFKIIPERNLEEFDERTIVYIDPDFPILFSLYRSKILFSHSGYVKEIDYKDEHILFIKRLNKGDKLRIIQFFNSIYSNTSFSIKQLIELISILYRINAIDILQK